LVQQIEDVLVDIWTCSFDEIKSRTVAVRRVSMCTSEPWIESERQQGERGLDRRKVIQEVEDRVNWRDGEPWFAGEDAVTLSDGRPALRDQADIDLREAHRQLSESRPVDARRLRLDC